MLSSQRIRRMVERNRELGGSLFWLWQLSCVGVGVSIGLAVGDPGNSGLLAVAAVMMVVFFRSREMMYDQGYLP